MSSRFQNLQIHCISIRISTGLGVDYIILKTILKVVGKRVNEVEEELAFQTVGTAYKTRLRR